MRGCIRKLKISRRSVDFHEIKDETVLKMEGIHECGSNPCSSVPCRNGGTCESPDAESFRCNCEPQFTGEFCENAVNPCLSGPCANGSVCDPTGQGEYACRCPPGRSGASCEVLETLPVASTPEFSGSSFAQFPRLDGVGKTFSIDVFFLARANNGLILYNGQMKNGRGDFISLNLVQGYLQFRFNLGSGIANIT